MRERAVVLQSAAMRARRRSHRWVAVVGLAGLAAVLLAAGSAPAAGASPSPGAGSKRKGTPTRTASRIDTAAPTKPDRLAVVSATSSSVTISWRRSADRVGVTGYIVYRDGMRVGSTPARTRRYTASGLACGTSHTYGVEAEDRAGNRSARATILAATAACTDTSAPSAPTNLARMDVTASSVTVSWSASSDNIGVVGYDVLRDGAIEGTTSATLYAVTALECGTMYTIGVRAYDGVGQPLADGQRADLHRRLPGYDQPNGTLLACRHVGQPELREHSLGGVQR